MSRNLTLTLALLSLWAAPPLAQGADRLTASSEHVDSTGNGAARLAFDGDLATSWVEGAPGFGRGEWVGITLDRAREVGSVTIFAGCFSSSRCYEEQAHGEKLFVEWTGPNLEAPGRVEVDVADAYAPVRVPVGASITSLKVGFLDLYDGARFSEGNIAEIAFDLGAPDAALAAATQANREKGKGKAKAEAWEASLQEALTLAKDPKTLEGALPLLMDAARLGDPVDRAYIAGRVPPGFALAYVPPHLGAIDALGQSRAISALPAIEQAAARTVDPALKPRLTHLAKWFKAYEAYSKATPEAIPYWGATGTVQGLLMSRGEPLSMDVDPEGRVFVADVGNNRIQRFTPQGRVDKATGAGRGIDEVYFGRPVDPFVVGAARGQGPGQFENPLFVEIVKGEDASYVATVDAGLRVQILTLDLVPVASWTVPSDGEILNGIGLRWPLIAQLKEGEVTVFVGKKAFVYDLKGTIARRFDLEAEPRGVATLKRRYLLVFGGEEVIAYTQEGYRDEVFFKLPADDRSEDIDIASDGESRVVVHSDNAVAYQLDKKGRLLTKQRTFKKPTYPCRVALHDGVLYVSHKDGIFRYEMLTPE